MLEVSITKDEFIGKTVTITSCTDPTLEQITGVIIDESKQIFHIEVAGHMKKVSKSIATFAVQRNEEILMVKGSQITFRPEDRIKKAR